MQFYLYLAVETIHHFHGIKHTLLIIRNVLYILSSYSFVKSPCMFFLE